MTGRSPAQRRAQPEAREDANCRMAVGRRRRVAGDGVRNLHVPGRRQARGRPASHAAAPAGRACRRGLALSDACGLSGPRIGAIVVGVRAPPLGARTTAIAAGGLADPPPWPSPSADLGPASARYEYLLY